jgi:hypothetical protein
MISVAILAQARLKCSLSCYFQTGPMAALQCPKTTEAAIRLFPEEEAEARQDFSRELADRPALEELEKAIELRTHREAAPWHQAGVCTANLLINADIPVLHISEHVGTCDGPGAGGVFIHISQHSQWSFDIFR